MDLLLVNLKLLGAPRRGPLALASTSPGLRGVRRADPYNWPVFGDDAFRTATGVHAAAIIKAEEKGDAWLADRIYSGVPAGALRPHQRSRSRR
jgi:2-isopropylmalate synthase